MSLTTRLLEAPEKTTISFSQTRQMWEVWQPKSLPAYFATWGEAVEYAMEDVETAPCIVCKEDVPDPGPDPRSAMCDECRELVEKG